LGMIRPPDLLRDACPQGYYCPVGTEYPVPCPAGRFGATVGLASFDSCTITPAGYYSIQASDSVTGLCEPGYYCPAGSTGPKQIPCPPRHYRPEYGGREVEDCSLCVAGGYCPEASSQPLICPKGYFCVTGIAEPEPCAPGTFGDAYGLRRAEECTLCSPGSYCDGYGLTDVRGLSSPGFYCIAGCKTSTPYALVVRNDTGIGFGDICPAGHYCPIGSSLPIPCAAGTFNGAVGTSSVSACITCSPGYYCEGLGNIGPTGLCQKGYYCPPGSKSAREIEVPKGGFAGFGASNFTQCPPGYYNSLFGQINCTECPRGYYCPNTGMASYESFICPMGHYCPARSQAPTKCPVGTYSAVLGNNKVADCTDCTPGSFCATTGLTSPTGPCSAGSYCTLGSIVSSYGSTTDSRGGICPVGHYCLENSAFPSQCPVGTYMSHTGATGGTLYAGVQIFCDLCGAGKACASKGMTSTGTLPCAAGYFCKMGAPSATPICSSAFCENLYGICPIGHYCPVGTINPLLCPDGTYMDVTGASVCKTCPEGYYCASNVAPERYMDCPLGYYCPASTGPSWIPCPAGRFGARTNLAAIDDCTTCPPGKYCSSAGLNQPNGNCTAGFYCPPGSKNQWGMTEYTGNNTCPRGSYCPPGSAVPLPCPPGTYNPHLGISYISECLPCSAGYYCDAYNLTQEVGLCDAGFFCKGSSPDRAPRNSTLSCQSIDYGDICPPGSYCPIGSASPIPCAPGTYNTVAGQSQCMSCPSGYHCVANSIYFEDCPRGYYCPNGTKFATEFPCPAGTYNNETNRKSLSDCLPSPPGYYAAGNGNTVPDGQCAAGYYCPHGAMSQTPSCASSFCTTGGKCINGQECVAGTSYPVPCSSGNYCVGGFVVDTCSAGYYCFEGATSPNPVSIFGTNGTIVADICPKGEFLKK
jgi:hypothetical protein